MSKNETDKGLNVVTYSRSYNAEKELPALIVGSSRWARDLELLLEDEWPNLSQADVGAELSDTLSKASPGLVLVEGTNQVEDIKLCLESTIPNSTRKVILLKEGENAFVKRTYLNYAAKLGISAVELPDTVKDAATELSALLSTLLEKVRLDIDQDIEKAELIISGFSIPGDVVQMHARNWSERSEKVLSWLFSHMTLTSSEYRLVKTLVNAFPIFQKRNQWTPGLAEIFLPLQTYAESTKSKEPLLLALALTKSMPSSGIPAAAAIEDVINKSSLGLLTKRKLKKEVGSLVGQTDISVKKSA